MRPVRVAIFTLLMVLSLALVFSAGGCAKKATSGASLPASGASAATGSGESTESLGGTVVKQPVSGTGGLPGTAGTSGGSGAGSGSGSGSSGGSVSKSGGSGNKPGTPTSASGMKVKVLWWNDTSSKAPKDWEIVYATSVVKPGSGKSGTGVVGPAPYGKGVELVIYPDGRGGKKIVVPFGVSTEMQADSETDAIHVAVSDTTVRVLGNPVFNVDQTYPRF